MVFPRVHDDVEEITLTIYDLAYRYDYRDEPLETVDISYRFKRKLNKVWSTSELATR